MADRDPLLSSKKRVDRLAVGLGIACVVLAVMVVVLAVALANANTSSPSPSPSPAPWNPDDYETAEKFYQNASVHGINVEDNMRMSQVGGPVLSKSGTKILFTVKQSQMPDFNKTTTTIWGLVLEEGTSWRNFTGSAIQLTRPEWGVVDSSPQWDANDEGFFFLSNRNKSSQIWHSKFDGNPKWPNFLSYSQISFFPVDVDNMLVSPTFDTIVFSAQVYTNKSMEETRDIDVGKAAAAENYKFFDKLYIRHWDQWVEKRNQPFVVPLSPGPKLGAHAVNILDMDSDVPTRPFGGTEEWSFSPDGKRFAFVRQHDEDANVSWTTNQDIFMIWITNATHPTVSDPVNLTPENPATDTQPRFSPDGEYLAYVAQAVPVYESDRYRVIIDKNGMKTSLTENWTLSVDYVTWSTNGSYLICSVLDDGETTLQRIPLEPVAEGEKIITLGLASSPVETPYGEWVFAFSTWNTPTEILSSEAKHEFAPTFRLTHFNDAILEKCQTTATTKFNFTGARGDSVSAWITRPYKYNPQEKYPVAVLIHGGPQSAWSQGWSYRWNPQLYAGRGFAVVMINPHGSTGYGQDFVDSIQGEYGSLPYEDIVLGLAAVFEHFSWMDSTRVAALGASFGGYMIYWIAGQPLAPSFKCLVAHDGMFDMRSFYYTTEELYFPEHDQIGTPFQFPENYEQWNPINHVANWTVPMLVIHGGMDYRVTEAQGLGAFTALQRMGVQSEFLYFPTENHWVLKPRNQWIWHNKVFEWIDDCTAE